MSRDIEISSQTSFGRRSRAAALSMNADSQDTESQMAQIFESQPSDDEAMPDMPEPTVEVPTSSALSVPDMPSTPSVKEEDVEPDEMVMETPREGSSRNVQDVNGVLSVEDPHAGAAHELTDAGEDMADSPQSIPDINEAPIMEGTPLDAESEPANDQQTMSDTNDPEISQEAETNMEKDQTNGTQKKERPAFNPYDTTPIIPRSPLEIGLDEQRLKALYGSKEDSASFEFLHEDHTLGNALRHVIMKNPSVELAGYSIPHPSELKMNVRIQMFDGASAYDALEQGIDDLDDMCDELLIKFGEAQEEFMEVDEQA